VQGSETNNGRVKRHSPGSFDDVPGLVAGRYGISVSIREDGEAFDGTSLTSPDPKIYAVGRIGRVQCSLSPEPVWVLDGRKNTASQVGANYGA